MGALRPSEARILAQGVLDMKKKKNEYQVVIRGSGRVGPLSRIEATSIATIINGIIPNFGHEVTVVRSGCQKPKAKTRVDKKRVRNEIHSIDDIEFAVKRGNDYKVRVDMAVKAYRSHVHPGYGDPLRCCQLFGISYGDLMKSLPHRNASV